MTLLESIQFATLAVLVLNALGVAALIILKGVNRARRRRAEARKRSHMRLISRHVAFENCTDPIPRDAATDPAFIPRDQVDQLATHGVVYAEHRANVKSGRRR